MQNDIENNNEQKEEKLNDNTTDTNINNYNDVKSFSEQTIDDKNSTNRKGKKSSYSNIINVQQIFSKNCGNFLNENIQLIKLKAKKYYYTYKQE